MEKWVFDSEIYRNFYLVAFKNIETQEVRSFRTPFDRYDKDGINSIIKDHTIIGFNSINFDLPLLGLALDGWADEKLKEKCDDIITKNIKWWQHSDLPLCRRHIDLIEVAPGIASLKIYGGRLNSKRMQSLPIHHDAKLTEAEKDLIEEYCVNDLEVTELLCKALSKQLKIRKKMGDAYDLDLMSKSDAQIAEAFIKSKMPTSKNHVEAGYSFKYKAPSWLTFNPAGDTEFYVQPSGKVKLPEFTPKNIVEIAGKPYKMGIGGLHSMEKSCYHESSDEVVISDHDVASYYPSIILNEGLYPAHLGDKFLTLYRGIVESRLDAKAKGDKVKADTLKIVINGSFGKFGSKWSVLYSPELLIQVTLTGQLALLMLIQDFEDNGIPVISANTDGVVVKCDSARLAARDEVIRRWEDKTGFVTEESRYAGLYSRDVNNYLAVKPDGTWKGKGVFAPPSLAKNTEHPVVYAAVVAELTGESDVESHITSETDITKFCSIRKVKDGAVDPDGVELGNAIRWYYSTKSKGPIRYSVNGNKVPKTEGAKALMDLPDTRVSDIDYNWYIAAAKGVLKDVGIKD